MNIKSVRKVISGAQLRSIFEDYVIPFAVGFALVSVYFWIEGLVNDDLQDVSPAEDNPGSSIPPTFLDKNGQLYLQRHGIQMKEADVFRNKADRLQFSIQARTNEDFKLVYVPYDNKRTTQDDEPPGTIWPWPRIEKEAPPRPLVWVVTPTYRNPYQYAELTRVAQAIYPARKFVRWLVVDDSKRSKKFKWHIRNLKTFLLQFNVNCTILKSKLRPPEQQVLFKPKGVEARRTALEYIRKRKLRGVVYFADDDNTYDSDIFRQIQATKTVSVWPTGAITQWTVSSPVVNENGTVIDFFDAFVANRKFPVDFASFAVNADLIHKNPEANIPWIQGYEETLFLKTLNVKKSELLPLAANATQVLTWHTKTVQFSKRMDTGSRETLWPSSVKTLMKKYDFLYESTEEETVGKPSRKRAPRERKSIPTLLPNKLVYDNRENMNIKK